MRPLDPTTVTVSEFVNTNDIVFRVRLSVPLRVRLRMAVSLIRVAAWLAGAATDIRTVQRGAES